MSGFITFERNTWDHPVLVRSEMSETEAWAWMIARASWAGTTHMVGDNLVDVGRGSFMITLRKLQSEFMWKSDKRVRNFLKKLEKHGMLAVRALGQRNARKTHVTICNYDKFQSVGRDKDAAKTHDGRTTDAVKKQGNKVTKRDTNVSLGTGASSKSDFQDFWDAYPHKGTKKNRQGAEASFARALKAGVTIQQIADGVSAMRNDPDVQRGYVRNPTTWLNQKGWTDEFSIALNFKSIDGGRHGASTHSTTGIASGRSGRDPALAQISRLTGI